MLFYVLFVEEYLVEGEFLRKKFTHKINRLVRWR